MDITGMVITVVGGLAIFLFGMQLMSDGLQKVAGPKMRGVLSAMTGNRFFGVGTGLVVTSAIQSSSATTVMLVGFVNAGLVTLQQSVGVIMGANIGTTMTAWLVALVGFKFSISTLALPAIAIGFFPRLFGSSRLADWGEVLLGFGVLFLGLDFMKESLSQLKESETIISWMAGTRADALGWRLAAVGVGAAVTLIVQSSSATMAITMTLAAQGMIDLPTACALCLGENIGTTVTANIAALGASAAAKRAARAHFLFNVFGVVWAVLLFGPFLRLVDALVPGSALVHGAASEAQLAATLAAFHTSFNVVNTTLFLPFTRQLAWLAGKLVPERKAAAKDHHRLLDPRLMASPPLALHAARSELKRMLDEVESMLGRLLMLISAPEKKLGAVAEAVRASEETVDNLEMEITEYLVAVTRVETSLEQSQEITGLLHAVGDAERMGDHCESILKLLARRYDKKLVLSDRAAKELTEIGDKVAEFLALLRENLIEPKGDVMPRARLIEDRINELRRQMRKGHVERLQDGSCEVLSGLLFIDMLTSFEKMGDHAYNIAEMIAGER
jgi:phosphate:Na+ symporter